MAERSQSTRDWQAKLVLTLEPERARPEINLVIMDGRKSSIEFISNKAIKTDGETSKLLIYYNFFYWRRIRLASFVNDEMFSIIFSIGNYNSTKLQGF